MRSRPQETSRSRKTPSTSTSSRRRFQETSLQETSSRRLNSRDPATRPTTSSRRARRRCPRRALIFAAAQPWSARRQGRGRTAPGTCQREVRVRGRAERRARGREHLAHTGRMGVSACRSGSARHHQRALDLVRSEVRVEHEDVRRDPGDDRRGQRGAGKLDVAPVGVSIDLGRVFASVEPPGTAPIERPGAAHLRLGRSRRTCSPRSTTGGDVARSAGRGAVQVERADRDREGSFPGANGHAARCRRRRVARAEVTTTTPPNHSFSTALSSGSQRKLARVAE